MPASGAYVVWTVLAVLAAAAVAARRRATSWWQPLLLAGVAGASVASFGIVSWGRATPFGDFNKAYYTAGSLILSDPSRLYACEISNLCFVNVPLVALVFTPFSWLERFAAQLVFTAIGALAVAAAAWLLIKELRANGVGRHAIVALFALSGPLLYSARLGNVTHVMLPLLVIAFASFIRGCDVRAGVLLAALTALKLPLLLFLPYFLLRGRWRAALAFGGTLAAILVVSVSLFGTELHALWLRGFVGPFAGRPVGAYNAQSIAGTLAHFMRPGNLTNWLPLEVSPLFTALGYAVVATLTGATAAAALVSGRPHGPAAQWTELSMVLVLALLASPLTWTHYYAFCVIPLAGYVTGTIAAPGVGWRVIVGMAAVLVSLPVVLAVPDHPVLRPLVERVLISHYVGGGVLLLAALSASRLALMPGRSLERDVTMLTAPVGARVRRVADAPRGSRAPR
jgi:Glycosyltransferase family 87